MTMKNKMPKYINADKLIKFCTGKLVVTEGDEIIQTHNNAFRCMREYIKSSPAADVVEVVRCKDCKYAMPEGRENVYICKAMTNPNYCWADDYCSCGERRETE